MTYCVIPRDLAPFLHETVHRHFRDDPRVDVVVERRALDRRMTDDRRQGAGPEAGPNTAPDTGERRLIRARSGRRVAERRATAVPVDVPELPRRARPHAARLIFVERCEPSALAQEDIDTARLVTRIQAGDHDAFAILYMRYFARVFGYLRPLLRNRHEAEDAVQDVFLSVLSALPRYERREQPFRAWLFRIVRNEGLMRLRSSGRIELRAPDELARARDDAGSADQDMAPVMGWISDRELLMFVERLPLVQRQVLLMRFMLGLTHQETAAILERTPADVRALQSRALRFLRSRLSALESSARVRRDVGVRRRTRQATVLRARRFALMRY